MHVRSAQLPQVDELDAPEPAAGARRPARAHQAMNPSYVPKWFYYYYPLALSVKTSEQISSSRAGECDLAIRLIFNVLQIIYSLL